MVPNHPLSKEPWKDAWEERNPSAGILPQRSRTAKYHYRLDVVNRWRRVYRCTYSVQVRRRNVTGDETQLHERWCVGYYFFWGVIVIVF